MIRDFISIDYILQQLETLLHINPGNNDIAEQVKISRLNIESQLRISLEDKTIYEMSGRDGVDMFLSNVTECLKNLSLYTLICSYDQKYSQTIKDVNYLGSEPTNLINCLKILQFAQLQHRRTEFLAELIQSVSSIQVCVVRRLFCVLAVMENIGHLDGVSIIACYLVLGKNS
jgi:hypothetical protein